MDKNKEILDNGIVFISHANKHVHSICFSLAFRVGSAYENDTEKGITHLVEHLFFRRLSDLPQIELYKKLNSMGTELLGRTCFDYVEFSVSVVPRFKNEAFEVMLKLFDEFLWECEEINAEKAIVKKQIANKVPSYSEWINSVYLQGSIYGSPIMSDSEQIDLLSCDEINAWKNKYFIANNACCVITGNYESDDLVSWKKSLQRLHSQNKKQNLLNGLPIGFCERTFAERYTIIKCDNFNSDVVIMFDVDNSVDYETIRLLISVLGEGCNSLLSKMLREKHKLTDDVFIELDCFNSFKRLTVSFTVDNHELEKSMNVFFDVIKDIDKLITEEEYNSSICFFTDNQLKDYDDIISLNHEYAICDFVIPTIASEPSFKKSIYEKIKVSDLVKCAEKVFVKNRFSVIIETGNDPDSVIECIEHNLEKL